MPHTGHPQVTATGRTRTLPARLSLDLHKSRHLPHSSIALDRNDLPASLEPIEIVRPCSHHRSALSQSLRLVVRGSDLVALGVRKLQLNQIRVPPLFIQQSAGHAAEPVSSMFIAGVTEPPQRGIQRVV